MTTIILLDDYYNITVISFQVTKEKLENPIDLPSKHKSDLMNLMKNCGTFNNFMVKLLIC